MLDADSYVSDTVSMDGLFDSYPESQLVAEGLGSDSPLRAGWIMMEPNQDCFNEMASILKRGQFDSSSGWDYMELNVEYPGWEKKNVDQWDFYGSQLEQGESSMSSLILLQQKRISNVHSFLFNSCVCNKVYSFTTSTPSQ